MKQFCAVVFLIGVAARANANADLIWDAREAAPPAALTDLEIAADFPFRNSGTAPVKIVAVKTCCGCVNASADRTTYAPGETGRVHAVLAVEQRQGPQEKRIMVTTDDPKEPEVTLVLKAHLTETIKLSTNWVTWKREGGDRLSKSIHVELALGFLGRALRLIEPDPSFHATLKQGKSKRQCKLTIEPKDTSAPFLKTLKLVSDYPPEHPKYTIV